MAAKHRGSGIGVGRQIGLSRNVAAFAKRVKQSRDKILRQLALSVYNDLLNFSPVDTGLFRGSWKIGINQPKSGPGRKRKTSQDPAALAAISKLKWGNKIFFTNTVDYAIYLEWPNVHSAQAPNGIVRPTMQRLRLRIAELGRLSRAKKGTRIRRTR